MLRLIQYSITLKLMKSYSRKRDFSKKKIRYTLQQSKILNIHTVRTFNYTNTK